MAAGAQADRRDPVKWHTAHGVLSVNGVKFIHWNQGRGGGGAIDLAMHLNATDFRGAVRWLAQHFPIPSAKSMSGNAYNNPANIDVKCFFKAGAGGGS